MIKQVGGEWCLFTKDGSRKLGCHPTKAEAEAQERVIEQKQKERRATLRASVDGIRTATFEGREHVVFNVVALVQGVLHASNAEAPELVLAEEFSKVPQGWNGRPVVLNHPELAGEKVSANEPRVLEAYQLGEVFHTEVRGDKLVMEAWIDPARVEKVGDEAARVLARVQAREVVEVSVGVFVQTEDKPGVYQGVRYAGVWREIVPDHLALLPAGTIGACSVEMGCGAPRAAKERTMSLMEKVQALIAKFTGAADAGLSDADTRNALGDALFASEPAFVAVVEVFPDAKEVIYATAPDGEPKLYRAGYEIGDDGKVTFAKAEEVKQVTRYEPVAAAAAPPAQEETASAAPCGCSGQGSDLAPTPKEDVMDKKQRVAAIIASGKTCFTAAQAPLLEAADEVLLKHIEDSIAAAPKEEPPAAQPEPLTEEKALAMFPRIKSIVEAEEARVASRKLELVNQLKDAAKVAYSEAELAAMDVPQLEKVAALVAKPKADFTPAAPRDASAEDRPQSSDELRAAMTARLKVAAAKQ